MKKLLRILMLVVLAVFLTASIASATSYDFGDNNHYWPGWNNNKPVDTQWGYTLSDDQMDVIGDPDFSGGVAEVLNNNLTKLTFYQINDGSFPLLSPGDLFLDTDPTTQETWNYIVDLTNWTKPSKNPSDNPDPGSGNYNVYYVNPGLPLNPPTGAGYILSGQDNSSSNYPDSNWTGVTNSWDWSGFNIRDDHPVASSGINWSPFAQVEFSGWGDILLDEYVFDFTLNGAQPGIPLDGAFTIGWTTNCANDVVYETVNPVPEPATLLLLGSGLLGLAGIGRKKVKKLLAHS